MSDEGFRDSASLTNFLIQNPKKQPLDSANLTTFILEQDIPKP